MSSVEVRRLAENGSLYPPSHEASPMSRIDADMGHILTVLAGMGGKPIQECKVAEARAQPTVAMALKRILKDAPDDGGVAMELRLIPGPAGDIRARVYTPEHAQTGRALPMILYLHGGGFVLGDLDDNDSGPRALCRRTGAVVVSSHYRQAPEFRFPAAHEDAFAAWRWMLEHGASLNGDPGSAAIVGEGSGGNLAVNIALRAHAEGDVGAVHLALITPMAAGMDFDLPSHLENAEAQPLGTLILRWYGRKLFRRKEDARDPRIRLVERADLGSLPPTTIILAEIDPLRSEGEALADALRRSGVWVDCTIYEGVTHGFFGLNRIVNKAMFAQSQLAGNLLSAFERIAERRA